MYQGSLGRLDPGTGKIAITPVPRNGTRTVQLNFTACATTLTEKLDQERGHAQHLPLDLKDQHMERFHPTDYLPADKVKGAGIYRSYRIPEQSVDGRIHRGHLGKIDAKTTKVTWWPFPTPNGRAAA